MSALPPSPTPSSPTPPPPSPPRLTIFGRGSYAEALRIGEILRKETVGGALLVAAAMVALIWANSPASESYFALRDFTIGYAPWHLDLSLGAWAADGLLAIFFFLVGLELKREFVAGDLRQPSKSVVPVAAAVGGVAVPALIYAAINLSGPETLHGWAIPTATDIAFAVAVLALIGSHLPSALRIFLLTLAVVDDLLAIAIIAIFYTSELHPEPLLLALLPLGLYTFLAHKYRRFFGTHAAGSLGDPAAARLRDVGPRARIRHPRHRGRGPARICHSRQTLRGPAAALRPARAWRRSSNTGSARSRPGSPSRSSRSFPPGWPLAAGRASAPP